MSNIEDIASRIAAFVNGFDRKVSTKDITLENLAELCSCIGVRPDVTISICEDNAIELVESGITTGRAESREDVPASPSWPKKWFMTGSLERMTWLDAQATRSLSMPAIIRQNSDQTWRVISLSRSQVQPGQKPVELTVAEYVALSAHEAQ